MFRRCVCLLVIVGMFASQLAAFPHAHASMTAEEQREHDSTPHFHTHKANGGHKHGHSHGHTRGEHRHEHKSQRKSAPKSVLSKCDGFDHDADAITVGVPPSGASPQKEMRSSLSIVTEWNSVAAAFAPVLPAGVAANAHWHPPDIVLDASDTFLTLRVLRI